MIDDERFALRFAEDKRELAMWGPNRIREALAGRGIEASLIDAALSLDDETQQATRAEGLLADRSTRLDSEQGRARALALLARRGYPLEVAYEAVRAHERRAA